MLHTSSSKPFKTESCLVASSIQHYQSLAIKASWQEDSTMILQEVNLGFGIADIVIIAHNSCFVKDNHLSLTKNDVFIYKLIEEQSIITIPTITTRTGLRKSHVISSLRKLQELDHIDLIDSDTYCIKNKYHYTVSSSIAIEAKLKDWKRALKQAYRYKWFASKSYVLLDEANIGPARRNIHEFHSMGVGLMAIGIDSKLRTIYDPEPSAPIDEKMTIMFNELVKTEAINYKLPITVKIPEITSKNLDDSCCFHHSTEADYL